jgi:Ca2+-transporting ATPase
MMRWHVKKEEEIVGELKSSEKGLTEKEAKVRLVKYGKNELVKIRKLNALRIFLRQYASFLVLILFLAAVVSAVLQHWIDFGVILAVVILNSMFGFFQEYKAERAIEKLKEMLISTARVLRNNKVEEIDSREIVPGDILVLREGDRIMADARLLRSENLQTNEAPLTGDSMPQDKKTGRLGADVVLGDRVNMVYKGTEIVRGGARAIVVSSGMDTEFGKIAEMVQRVEPEKNPLKKRLDSFAKVLGIVALVLIGFVVVVGIALGFGRLQIFLTGVSLAVSTIPEGLPAVITIGLAFATQRMLKMKSLVRKLPAAETLGRATFICTDKTGTITEEKMVVKEVYVNGSVKKKVTKSKEDELLFKVGVLCNNARLEKKGIEEYVIGDPTEKALLIAGKQAGLDKKSETEKEPRVREFSFTSERKMMSIVRKSKKGSYVSYVKGAPEVILKKCNTEYVKGRMVEIDEGRRKRLMGAYEEMASRGFRVLAFAYKLMAKDVKVSKENAERNLVFVGLQAMIDPPREGVKEAIKKCENAGIKVLMLTGDSALTAKTVGEEIGLRGKIVSGEQLEKMSDEELGKEIYDVAIFARISPGDKLRIVEVLKSKKEIVAVTGDGVNDAPALKKADIGIAVGRGTDVAKDASDIILVDNNFASIVKSVREGRRVYDNIKKFVKYMLSANFDEIMLVMFGIFMGFPLILLPLQILWINLITDSFPALALSTEEAEGDVMKRKPKKEGILKGVVGFIILAGLLAFIISFVLFYLNIADLSKARTMAVTTGVIFEMFLVFNCKSSKSVFKSKWNKYIVYAVLLSVFLHLLVIYTPISALFEFSSLGIFDWLKIVGLCAVCFVIMEYAKLKSKFV